MKKLEKIWCTYGGFLGPWGFGKIVKESSEHYYIQYSEGQLYSPECWDPKWVKRFNTLEESLEHYAKSTKTHIYLITEWAKKSFPSAFKKIQ